MDVSTSVDVFVWVGIVLAIASLPLSIENHISKIKESTEFLQMKTKKLPCGISAVRSEYEGACHSNSTGEGDRECSGGEYSLYIGLY